MARILALDVGDVRIGIAISDPLAILATPLKTVARAGAAAEKEILEILQQHQISDLVVGLPLLDNGAEGEQARRVRLFLRRICRRIRVRVHWVDEHLSSVEAADLLQAKPAHLAAQKMDAAAAAVILQRYLDQAEYRIAEEEEVD